MFAVWLLKITWLTFTVRPGYLRLQLLWLACQRHSFQLLLHSIRLIIFSPISSSDYCLRLLGLCNNFAYVVMLSAAHDILKKQESANNTASVRKHISVDVFCIRIGPCSYMHFTVFTDKHLKSHDPALDLTYFPFLCRFQSRRLWISRERTAATVAAMTAIPSLLR